MINTDNNEIKKIYELLNGEIKYEIINGKIHMNSALGSFRLTNESIIKIIQEGTKEIKKLESQLMYLPKRNMELEAKLKKNEMLLKKKEDKINEINKEIENLRNNNAQWGADFEMYGDFVIWKNKYTKRQEKYQISKNFKKYRNIINNLIDDVDPNENVILKYPDNMIEKLHKKLFEFLKDNISPTSVNELEKQKEKKVKDFLSRLNNRETNLKYMRKTISIIIDKPEKHWLTRELADKVKISRVLALDYLKILEKRKIIDNIGKKGKFIWVLSEAFPKT